MSPSVCLQNNVVLLVKAGIRGLPFRLLQKAEQMFNLFTVRRNKSPPRLIIEHHTITSYQRQTNTQTTIIPAREENASNSIPEIRHISPMPGERSTTWNWQHQSLTIITVPLGNNRHCNTRGAASFSSIPVIIAVTPINANHPPTLAVPRHRIPPASMSTTPTIMEYLTRPPVVVGRTRRHGVAAHAGPTAVAVPTARRHHKGAVARGVR